MFTMLAASIKQATGSASDPYFANVQSLMHFEASFLDQKGRSWSASGASITSASPLVGVGSGSFHPGYISSAGISAYDFLTGDFCIEISVKFLSLPSSAAYCLFSSYQGSGAGFSWQLRNDGGTSRLQVNTQGDTGNYLWPWTPVIGTRYDLSVTRVSGQLRLFVNGVAMGSPFSAPENITGGNVYIGALNSSGTIVQVIDAVLDEWRMTVGQGRYSADYTVSLPFPNS